MTGKPQPNHCAFCDKAKGEVQLFIWSSNGAALCENCLGLALIALATEKPNLFERLVSEARPQP
jgi:hypothetical protein